MITNNCTFSVGGKKSVPLPPKTQATQSKSDFIHLYIYTIFKMDSYRNSHMNLCRSLHLDDLSSLCHVHHHIHHDHYRRKDY